MQPMDTNKANVGPAGTPRPARLAGVGRQRARAIGPAVAALAAAGLLGGCGTAQLASEQPPRQPASKAPAASATGKTRAAVGGPSSSSSPSTANCTSTGAPVTAAGAPAGGGGTAGGASPSL